MKQPCILHSLLRGRLQFLLSILASVLAACGNERDARSSEATSDVRLAGACVSPRADTGRVSSPDGSLNLRVDVADKGLRRLSLTGALVARPSWTIEDDITNLAFLRGDSAFVYASGPLYGDPGVYRVELASGRRSKLIAARFTRDEAYPNGTDYIVLCDAIRLGADTIVVRLFRYSNVETDSVWVTPPRVPLETDTVRLRR